MYVYIGCRQVRMAGKQGVRGIAVPTPYCEGQAKGKGKKEKGKVKRGGPAMCEH